MSETFVTVGYLVAAVFFIRSIGGLSRQETARRGNVLGAVGMALALGLTFASGVDFAWVWAVPALIAGAVVGGAAAMRVEMTAMPEMVGLLNSFVGLAAVLVGFGTYLEPGEYASVAAENIHHVEVFLAIAIGSLTFTGSIVAWGKLRGTIPGKAVVLPGRNVINAVAVAWLASAAAVFLGEPGTSLAMNILYANAVVSGLLGVHLVMAIGGADMPVVVSLLNSYSGWSAAAAGFMLSNDLLIVTGALVGSSGAILSYIMCRGMNRTLWNVVFGGYGPAPKPAGEAAPREQGDHTPVESAEVAERLRRAKRVVIVPGYGMAVARAQHAVSGLVRALRGKGIEVVFGIHEVAGRMPGHMNVLLAEADIPYDIVLEREACNDKLHDADVALVIGANDIVNPDALDDASSPIYMMPQIEVWRADRVVVLKRSLSPGYAGVQNPLFFRDNTWMYFGDARETVEDLVSRL